jgi:thiol-disulfide isomerase/thioredoxin
LLLMACSWLVAHGSTLEVSPTMTVQPDDKGPGTRRRRLAILIGAAVVAGAGVGLAAVYGIGSFQRNAGDDAACRPAVEMASRLAPLVRGQVAAMTMATRPQKLPELAFQDGAGQTRTLADWRGRVVLLNLWATWCVPCRKEMPALDGLEVKLGGPHFQVVAVNIDTRDPDKPRTWVKETGIDHLVYYADASARVFQELKLAGKAFGMPTTLIVDPQGCEIGNLAGPAEWASDDAVQLITAALRG